MKSYVYILVSGFAVILSLFATPAISRPAKEAFDSSIIVLAPTSLTNALNTGLRMFSSKNNISVGSVYDDSAELYNMIQEGEAANIFITDDNSKVIDMQRLGLLNVYSLNKIATDSLVIVAPKNSFLKRQLEKFEDVESKMQFLARNVTMVIPDPDQEAAGKAAQQAFQKIRQWENVKAKMLRSPNTRNALYLIANGNNIGVIYRSDAVSDSNVEILIDIPQEYYDKIEYQASIVAELNSEDKNEVNERFMSFLKSDIFKRILKDNGFGQI